MSTIEGELSFRGDAQHRTRKFEIPGSRFARPGMTWIDATSHSRGALRPEFCSSLALINTEGAGKTGCALHPRSRVRVCKQECAHEHTGTAENTRPSLRNGFTAYTWSPW